MQWKSTGTNPITALGYDEESWTCCVRFAAAGEQPQGPVYAFADVPPEVFADLEAAPDLEAFFKERLAQNPAHPYTRLQEPQPEAAGRAFSSPEEALQTAQAIAREAEALQITTPEAYRAAGEELVRLAGERRRRVEFFRPMKEAAFTAHKTVCARENEALAPLRKAEQALSEGLVAYRREEEAKRRELQSAWNFNALPTVAGMPEAGEWMPSEAVHGAATAPGLPMREATQPDDGEAFPQASVAVPPVVARAVPAVAGLSFAKDWDFEVVEPALVPLSHEWYSLDERKLRGYVKRMREHAQIPGIRVFPKERSRTRVA